MGGEWEISHCDERLAIRSDGKAQAQVLARYGWTCGPCSGGGEFVDILILSLLTIQFNMSAREGVPRRVFLAFADQLSSWPRCCSDSERAPAPPLSGPPVRPHSFRARAAVNSLRCSFHRPRYPSPCGPDSLQAQNVLPRRRFAPSSVMKLTIVLSTRRS